MAGMRAKVEDCVRREAGVEREGGVGGGRTKLSFGAQEGMTGKEATLGA